MSQPPGAAAAALAVLVTTIALLGGCRKQAPPVDLDVTGDGALVFPPESTGWRERAPLPPEVSTGTLRSDDTIQVVWPQKDAKGHFVVHGQIVRLGFNDAVFAQGPNAKPPSVEITPGAKGETVWSSPSDLEFRARKPFDPDVEYTLRIPEITGPSGKKLEGGFSATFHATPEIEIAGKTIYYVPKPGHARVLRTLPTSDSHVGGPQEIRVLYDQPVDLAVAGKRVSLSASGEKVATAVRLGQEGTFDGAKVDPRYVVVVRPRTPLPPGSKLEVVALPQVDDEDAPTRVAVTVADPTKLLSVGCGSSECEVRDTFVRTAHTSGLRLQFNNPLGLGYSEGPKHVHVTPAPRNLWISGWGEELSIGGSFTPSTTYAVRIEGVRDQYGGPVPALTLTMQTRPLPTSMTIPAGVAILDTTATRAFPVSTRNVERAELLLWAIPKGDASAFERAVHDSRAGKPPTGDPTVVAFTPAQRRDEMIETVIDLSPHVVLGNAYVAGTRIVKGVEGAEAPRFPKGSPASEAALGVVITATSSSLGAHVHEVSGKSIVQVFRMGSGEPVSGARVELGSSSASTDALGTAIVEGKSPSGIVSVTTGDASLMLPTADAKESAASLFPKLAAEPEALPVGDTVALLVTDRGVYRPGTRIFVKGLIRRLDGAAVVPVPSAKIRLHVLDPLGADVLDEAMTASPRGSVTKEIVLDKHVHTGRLHVRLELDDAGRTPLADEIVRVAEFETPRFKVDVEPIGGTTAGRLKARVVGRYLFGAPMSGARVTWMIRKTAAPVRGGRLAEQGLSFARESFWDEDGGDDASHDAEAMRPVTGEGVLSDQGALDIDAVTGALAGGPTELTLEADVTDASNRHVAGTHRVVADPLPRHAGLKLARRFGDAGTPLRIELGVVDKSESVVVGAKVSARVERLTWTKTAERAESGAIVERWRAVATTTSQCEVVSAATPVACDLAVGTGGSYRVVASVDGHDGARVSYYVWGGAGGGAVTPSSGKKLPLVTDKEKYAGGETAKLLVQSPYSGAIALLTVEQGKVVHHEAKRIDGASGSFDVQLRAGSGPWVHATVTLIPLGGVEPDYRVGAIRIPVGQSDARLDVKVSSGRPSYEVREEAEIAIEVRRAGAPVSNADVTLAVVDEGVLRMTNFHAKDPLLALRPGRPLDFRITDSRSFLIARRERAHAAGGGDSEGEDALDVRKDFVETAAWMPNLSTDANGRVVAKVKLPDNLTEFRMMAVVVDEAGRGGTAESSFVVTKPIVLDPVLPRFTLLGDRFEAAAMVHNNTDAPLSARVTIGSETRDVTVPAKSRARASVPMNADRLGTHPVLFAVEAPGGRRDRVEVPLRTDRPGIDEHPELYGVFKGRREITLAIPGDAIFDDDASLVIKTGSALYPELGHRLGYLLDYPHGCVEQTTSSTLPLLAARTILPWTGTTWIDDDELARRIRAGVDRLASMSTSEGGLAYWPGGTTPNVYGSAYALLALVRAKEMGIERPKLVDIVTKFLGERLGTESDPGEKAAIAAALALAHALEESHADMLFDSRENLDAFGLANLAIALGSLPKQDDRVRDVLDRLEQSFEPDGTPKKKHDERDHHYWGSDDRDRAMATMALTKLRKASPLLPVLAKRLSSGLDGYTTQTTAYSLLALAEHIGDRKPEGGVNVKLRIEGHVLDTYAKLGGDNKEIRVPLRELAGRRRTLVLEGDDKTPSAFAMEARYERPLSSADSRIGKRAPKGVSIHRAYSDPAGRILDLSKVKAGQLVRVALRVELPELDEYRRSYLAITDRLPAGFEAVNPDLATTAYVPDLAHEHPFHDGLSNSAQSASHVELHDDRVQVYFDREFADTLYATYLVRVTTPGTFALPPAYGELMYEPGSGGFSDAGSVTVQ